MIPRLFLRRLTASGGNSGSQPSACTTCTRGLMTAADAATALRPVYFAVHPDFFGNYPEIRRINEHSLKLLNGFLSTACSNSNSSLARASVGDGPIELMFFVRPTDAASRRRVEEQTDSRELNESRDIFLPIKVQLGEREDAQSVVYKVLQSFSLSTDSLKKPSRTRTSTYPGATPGVDWEQVFKTFTAHQYQNTADDASAGAENMDPEFEDFWKRVSGRNRRRPDPPPRTLLAALRKLGPEANSAKQSVQSVSSEVAQLVNELCGSMGTACGGNVAPLFREISWETDWALTHIHGTLSSLKRVLGAKGNNSRRPVSRVVDNDASAATTGATKLTKRPPKLKLSNGKSFLDATGDVVLGFEDVPEHWLHVFQRFGSPFAVQSIMDAIEIKEGEIQELLGGRIRLQRPQYTPAVAYNKWLQHLAENLRKLVCEVQKPEVTHVQQAASDSPYTFKRYQHQYCQGSSPPPSPKLQLETVLPAEASDLSIIVDGNWGSPMVSHSGHLIVPFNQEPHSLLEFLKEHSSFAKYRQTIWSEQERMLSQLKVKCCSALALQDITWEAEQLLDRRILIASMERLAEVPSADSDAAELFKGHFLHILASTNENVFAINCAGKIVMPVNWEL